MTRRYESDDHSQHSGLYESHVCMKSPAWRIVCAVAMLRALGACEHCHETGRHLSVAHVDPGYPTLGRERLDDVVVLCDECHRRLDHGDRWSRHTVLRTIDDRLPRSDLARQLAQTLATVTAGEDFAPSTQLAKLKLDDDYTWSPPSPPDDDDDEPPF